MSAGRSAPTALASWALASPAGASARRSTRAPSPTHTGSTVGVATMNAGGSAGSPFSRTSRNLNRLRSLRDSG